MRLLPVYRVTVFVPPEHAPQLKAGLASIEGLRLGNYDQVMWTSAPGVEQFRPLEGARPGEGRVGALSEVTTLRIEFAIARDPALLQRVLEQGVYPHHPWEVPAIFVDAVEFPLPDAD